MHQADIGEHLMASEAAAGLAGETAGRIVLAVRVSALAPGIVA
jgi:hypothetical protein